MALRRSIHRRTQGTSTIYDIVAARGRRRSIFGRIRRLQHHSIHRESTSAYVPPCSSVFLGTILCAPPPLEFHQVPEVQWGHSLSADGTGHSPFGDRHIRGLGIHDDEEFAVTTLGTRVGALAPTIKPSSNPITDQRINDVLDRLHARASRQLPGLVAHLALNALKGLMGGKPSNDSNEKYVRNKMISIDRSQGWLIYMLCRGIQARRVVEFGTSYGVSTLYLAAAIRDEGGGLVIGTEIEPEKARHARNHFAAGVAELIEVREGDALITLKDCGGPVDFVLVDGFPKLARPIIELIAPQLRKGAIIVADNVGHFPKAFADYLDFVRRSANGFVSTLLPLKGGTELSVKI